MLAAAKASSATALNFGDKLGSAASSVHSPNSPGGLVPPLLPTETAYSTLFRVG